MVVRTKLERRVGHEVGVGVSDGVSIGGEGRLDWERFWVRADGDNRDMLRGERRLRQRCIRGAGLGEG